MVNLNKDLELLLSNEVINTLLNSKTAQIAQFTAAIALLIKLGISFDVVFTQNTRRDPATAILTVFINSTASVTTAITFTISFDN